MSEINHQLAELLLQIEAELRHLELWQAHMPDAAALESTTPFCADTLYFNQWLQWIFIPRMKQILEASYPLPVRCEIHPYAEEFCRKQEFDTQELSQLIREFDRLINNEVKTAATPVVRH